MIDIQYLELLEEILTKGHSKGGRNGGTKSIFSAQIKHDMKDGFPLLTTKKMPWHQVRTEFLWMVKGMTNIKWLLENGNRIWLGDCYKNYTKKVDNPSPVEEFENKILKDRNFASIYGELGPIYGKQYRRIENVGDYIWYALYIDQLEEALETLRTNPESRKILVSTWNVIDLIDMVLEPCHFGFKFYTRPLSQSERTQVYARRYPDVHINDHIEHTLDENNIPKYALSLKWYQRSVDVPLGLPFNIAFYAIMLEVYARLANMIPETLIGDLTDVHIYDNQIDGVYKQLDREPVECTPKLEFSKDVDFGGSFDYFAKSAMPEHLKVIGYKSRPKIKFPLSN